MAVKKRFSQLETGPGENREDRKDQKVGKGFKRNLEVETNSDVNLKHEAKSEGSAAPKSFLRQIETESVRTGKDSIVIRREQINLDLKEKMAERERTEMERLMRLTQQTQVTDAVDEEVERRARVITAHEKAAEARGTIIISSFVLFISVYVVIHVFRSLSLQDIYFLLFLAFVFSANQFRRNRQRKV